MISPAVGAPAMSRHNPLVVEVSRGLAGAGPSQVGYLGYLTLQALVLFIWWPKSELYRVLAAESAPNTLLAVIIGLGVTVAYYGIRAGAEEILLPGQQPLGEWVLATPLALGRILFGYLCGHLLQTLHAIVLSLPLLLAAFSVAGGEWAIIGWSLAAVLVQATFYRLVGTVVYLTIGQHRIVTLFSLRILLLAGYAATPALHPAASHLLVSYHLLKDRPSMHLTAGVLPEPLVFVLVYAGLSGMLMLVLYLLLSRHRRLAAVSSG